jgi:formylglycine-generating enzyme required for sulfatase activity
MTKLALVSTVGSVLLGLAISVYAVSPESGRAVRTSSKGLDKPEMVYVPSGEFLMGHNPPTVDYGPIRRIYQGSFWITKNDITVSQFADFCDATGFKFDWQGRKPPWGWDGKDNRPMVNVTWDEARAYCKWAGGDLPTEAEWEKAARGIDGRNYPWGNDWAANRAWYPDDNEAVQEPAPIGRFPKGASPYGCLDMSGNVAQWCRDWYGPVDTTEVRNPAGPGFGTRRSVRGGSFHERKTALISWFRSSQPPNEYSKWIGFRCMSLKP